MVHFVYCSLLVEALTISLRQCSVWDFYIGSMEMEIEKSTDALKQFIACESAVTAVFDFDVGDIASAIFQRGDELVRLIDRNERVSRSMHDKERGIVF